MAEDFAVEGTQNFVQASHDLGSVPDKAGPFINSAVQHTSRLVRDSWRERSSGSPYAPAFPYSITYDLTVYRGFGVSLLRSEIGPDKARPQGALGNLLEFGSVNNPPRGFGLAALQEHEDDLERGLDQSIDDALKAAGL
jgi:hypothetical protein